MRKINLFGIMSYMMLTACGKGMHVVAANQNKNAGVPASGKVTQPEDALNGTLYPLSEYDMSTLKDIPYPNLGTDGKPTKDAVTQIGATTVAATDSDAGYNKKTNVVFRAVLPIPETQMVQKDVVLKLHLQGVRLFAEGGKGDEVLKTQMLCLLDSDAPEKACIGGPQDATLTSKTFWAKSSVNGSPLTTLDLFSQSSVADSTGVVYDFKGVVSSSVAAPADATSDSSANDGDPELATDPKAAAPKDAVKPDVTADSGTGELVIDLRQVFNLKTDKDAMQFIQSHTQAYDVPKVYRKFQVVVANNLTVLAGRLEFSSTNDPKIGTPYNPGLGVLMHGDADINQKAAKIRMRTKSVDGVIKKASFQLDQSKPLFGDDLVSLTPNAVNFLDTLAAVVVTGQSKLSEIKITAQMDVGTDEASVNETIAQKRAQAVATELKAKGVTVTITPSTRMISATSCKKSDGTPDLDCEDDRKTNFEMVFQSTLSAEEAYKITKDINDNNNTPAK